MNERIKQLKEQARDFYLLQEDLDCSVKQLHELVDAKFAELIIKECAKFLDENSGYDHTTGWHPEPEELLEHFGVQE